MCARARACVRACAVVVVGGGGGGSAAVAPPSPFPPPASPLRFNIKGTCFVCITVVLGQFSDLSKEMCLYAGAVKLICEPEGGKR